MTPHELNLALKVFDEKQKQKGENDLLLAYMTAYFHRIEKLESFDTYRKKMSEPEKKVMSDEEMLAKVTQLHGLFGGIAQ